MAKPDLSSVPNFCAHEHWGSISSIGSVPEGFRADVERGAMPKRATRITDLLLDPYFRGLLGATGVSPDELAKKAGVENFDSWAAASPDAAYAALEPAIRDQQLTGTYQCIRRGVLRLYDKDIDDVSAKAREALNAEIGANYARIFSWYRETMKRAHFTELIRPVHPEFYVRVDNADGAKDEAAFTRTVMRIDPLLHLHTKESPRRDGLAAITGIEPTNAESWRAFLAALFELAAKNGAVGIKQLQAYGRSLQFDSREDSDVVWSGDLTPEQVRVFKDWVVRECCRLANEREWPHQIHVGTHNLDESSPLPLEELSKQYPRMKIVMLHCWPFLREAGWLAKQRPNIYIDTCWQPILNPEFYREAMRLWLNYVPRHKIMCPHDATSIEMAVGSSLFTREILAESLELCTASLGVSHTEMMAIALDMFHNNAVAVYGYGEKLT